MSDKETNTEKVNEALSDATEPLHLTEGEPEQGEQFTEPKIGGLYPMAGILIGGIAIGGVAMWFALS